MDSEQLNETPAPSWETLGLCDELLELVRKEGFKAPTPIQNRAIPVALDGRDLIASAETGTGKTASFAFPMIQELIGREGTYGLVLAPTREIALQIQKTFEVFGKPLGVRSIALIGGVDMRIDTQALDTYPQVIVATPGRLCDHLERGNIWLDFIRMFVLDEADRMLDMGFSTQLNQITAMLPSDRQTLLFSATITPTVEHLAKKILHEPEYIAIGKPTAAAKSIEQRLLWVSRDQKFSELRRLLRQIPGRVIVFTRSKAEASRLWSRLHASSFYDSTYLSSDRIQAHRELALERFKTGHYRIMVATDVAARGLHIEAVEHVVNYDLPLEPEDYIHRIGRTGRAGATGVATTFATSADRRLIERIRKLPGVVFQEASAPGASSSSPSREGEGRRGEGRRGGQRGGGRRGERGESRTAGASPASADEDQARKRRRRRRGRRGGGGSPSGAPQTSS